MSAWRHLRAILFLPFLVTVVVPGALLYLTGSARVGWGWSGVARVAPVALGLALIAGGLSLVIWTVRLFASAGRGTLAPWDPTRRLVVQGPYRHVRNPMISGVLGVLLGEAALSGSPALLAWSGTFFLANAVYLPLVEERGLEDRFGDDFRLYRRNVPRWLPRLTPWQGAPSGVEA
jgi:protein-S-isoprenylcysteine O-methyltransferase Ste14